MTSLRAIPILLLVLAGCQRRDLVVGETDEGEPALASVVSVSEPAQARQLVSGFHDLEPGGWRWTSARFSVALGVPPGAAARGGRLVIALYTARPLMKRFGAQTLTLKVAGRPLPPKTFRGSAEHVYSGDVARDLLAGESVLVEGAVEPVGRPGEFDSRELGLIVRSFALEPKEVPGK